MQVLLVAYWGLGDYDSWISTKSRLHFVGVLSEVVGNCRHEADYHIGKEKVSSEEVVDDGQNSLGNHNRHVFIDKDLDADKGLPYKAQRVDE